MICSMHVHHGKSTVPPEVIDCDGYAELLAKMPGVLARHPHCSAIHVDAGLTRLFSVDCKGAPLK